MTPSPLQIDLHIGSPEPDLVAMSMGLVALIAPSGEKAFCPAHTQATISTMKNLRPHKPVQGQADDVDRLAALRQAAQEGIADIDAGRLRLL